MTELFSQINPTVAKKYFHHVFEVNYPHKLGNSALQDLVDEYNRVTGFNIKIPEFSSPEEKQKFIFDLEEKLHRAQANIVHDFHKDEELIQTSSNKISQKKK